MTSNAVASSTEQTLLGEGVRWDARQLTALRNDVGLLSEEYDPQSKRLLGNFPQAFSHIGLLLAIYAISEARR